MNSIDFPLFEIHLPTEILLEYLLNVLRLDEFRKCKKLNFEDFGEGDFNQNLLLIGGDRVRIQENIPLVLLNILSTFNLRGNFDIYVDKFGFFELLQRNEKQILSNQVYESFLMEFWGKGVVIDPKKRVKLDEIIADVDIEEGNTQRQVIPLFGHVLNFAFNGKANLSLRTKKGFFIGRNKKDLELRNVIGNFVIDTRPRPIEKNYDMHMESDLVLRWLKGMEAIK